MGTTQGHCEVCGEGLGLPDAFRHRERMDCIKRLKADVEQLRIDAEAGRLFERAANAQRQKLHECRQRLVGCEDKLERLRAENAKLRDSVKAADDGREEWESTCKTAEEENEQLRAERDSARGAARWVLPFLVNEPQHLATATKRWPWLKD